jgi:hypothetical protein
VHSAVQIELEFFFFFFFLLLPLKTPCPSVLGQFKKQGRKENKERKEGKKKG